MFLTVYRHHSPSFYNGVPPPIPLPALRSRFSQIQLGGLRERCKLHSGVWDRAHAEIEFGALNDAIWWQQIWRYSLESIDQINTN